MTDILDHLEAVLADRYAIERELGAGGMATVYLAEDLKHHRKVAVRVASNRNLPTPLLAEPLPGPINGVVKPP